jgi:hypothetical protein
MATPNDDLAERQRRWEAEHYGRNAVIRLVDAPSRPNPKEPTHVTLNRIEQKIDRLTQLLKLEQ